MFTISVDSRFSGAHRLVGYQGKCSALHGHNWKVSAAVRVDELNQIGMSIDFETLKSLLKEVTDQLDHKYLNELEEFSKTNPTSEHIASHIFRKYRQKLSGKAKLTSVTVWESEGQSVTYSP
ncbi:MAG: 6-carboxytetrahydropterin synthase QueD [Candidatus Eisenbacteria bacterium]|nr:6-carboxytetrahydropterin synthase QueD [Candidatus Eisenbacteria bacterium]